MLDFSNKKSFRVIGVMSGTSLDGLDICLCNFALKESIWTYKIERASTITYDDELKDKLTTAYSCSGKELAKLDFEYGRWIGKQINNFINVSEDYPDIISSHGHTIFHHPKEGYTLQIGKGAAIASETNTPCICDFRSSDVSRVGQGAPLVPIGDKLLFSEFDICLNLGGFSNLSFEKDNKRFAFDISPCNILLNHLAQKLGKNYDNEGLLGSKGFVDNSLLNDLDSIDFYHTTPPKSLAREWFEELLLPIFDKYELSNLDKLRTAYEHISNQICYITNKEDGEKILVTGGGAHNNLLIHLIRNKSKHIIVKPDSETIDYKEALIFAFLGVLYVLRKPGALSTVTGAIKDSISGCLYF
jgi:anhydro-N-acetylmuramic acid kinase